MKSKILGGIALTALAGGCVFASSGYFDRKLTVKTTTVERGQIATFVSAPGNVINREELSINSPIAGQLVEFKVMEGQEVEKGQVLARFDSRESENAAGIARVSADFAQQTLAQAMRDLEDTRRMFEVGGEAQRTVRAAELKVQSARKDLQLAKAHSQQAQFDISKRLIKAPSAGTIIASYARVGAWNPAGTSLFKLAPVGPREIEIRLDAADGAAAVIGKEVSVTSDAFVGRSWSEKITWVAPVTSKDSTSNSLSVRLSLGTEAPPLVLGQQVDVKITTAAREQILKIPSSAIMSKQGRPMVAVVQYGAVHFKAIEMGIGDATSTEVLHGVEFGQRVVLPEGKTLNEGDKIDIGSAETQ